ncbi:MAG: hypothetical protein LBP93_06215 [Treponema sp.]|jgi:ribosome-associated toxin RatA of RatAB toxin-antitoxin module|nr:hypothetical protein [Treponema sp.]
MLLYASRGLGALEGEVIPSEGVLKKITGRPQALFSEVTAERGDDDSRWIRMYAGAHVCTELPLEKLYPVISDYENYPAVFKRNRTARVFEAEGEGVYQDVEVGIILPGISYTSRYRTLIIEKEHTPSRLILEFTGVSSDGSVKDVSAQWYFETLLLDGRPYTYIRYIQSSSVVRKSIFQKTLMTMFLDSETTAMLNQLLNASK